MQPTIHFSQPSAPPPPLVPLTYLSDEEWNARHPTLWGLCYPRVYAEPTCGQYYSSRGPAQWMAHTIRHEMSGPTPEVEKALMPEITVAAHLSRNAVPTFWLSKDMAQAIRQTVPPGVIDWHNMHLPFESAVIMLPKGSFRHADGTDLAFLVYARLTEGEAYKAPLLGDHTYSADPGTMYIFAQPSHGAMFRLEFDRRNMPTLTLPDLDASEWGTTPISCQGAMSIADHRVNTEAAHFIFGALLLMTERPDLVTMGSQQKRVTKRGSAPREFWTPNVIGLDYKIRRESVAQGGTHNSPRLHWVRGFYRQQVYGPKSALRKQQ